MSDDREIAQEIAMMSLLTCSRCGRDPALGWAFIGDERYCHGTDEDWDLVNVDPNRPTCYEIVNRNSDERDDQIALLSPQLSPPAGAS